ncbi:MAG: prenyltransferase [Kiritimatiellae bacterium]|nr:prenyltransferase [Kiritimatiellia bacterium]
MSRNPIARFLELSRSPFFVAIIVPALLGTALAWREAGAFDLPRFIVALLGLVAAHAGGNLFNDYFDFRLGADRANPYRGPFSGGSPHIVEGREPDRAFLRLALGSFAVALACGAWLAWVVDRGFGPIVVLALAGAFCGVFYTTPPLKFSYRGFGEVCIFLAFGVLPVAGAYYVQTGILTKSPFFLGLPPALLITNIIWINQFPDREPDAAAGKRHLVARLRPEEARWGYHGMAAAAFVLIAVFALQRGATWLLLGLAGLPPALAAALCLHRHCREPLALRPAQALTIAAHVASGLGLCAGVLLR